MQARAKLLPPPVARTALSRPRIDRRLDEAFGARLTTIVAGSGFGKSTAIAAWAADVRCVWYALTPEDASLGSFARGLGELVEAATGRPLAGPSPLEGEAGDRERPETLAAYLARELDRRLAHDLVVVLDDVHELGAGASSALLVDALCRQLPPTVHLILASRLEPPFPTTRLRGRGELLELDAAELAFDPDELQVLAAGELGRPDTELVTAIFERTSGWPAAVRLLLERLRRTPEAERRGALELLPTELFSYLAEEVLESEPESTRELIRILSPFERVSAELAEELGVVDAARTLESLVRRGLFVVRHGAERDAFALHGLVRELASSRFPEEGERSGLHARAARWYEARGEVVAALQAFVLAREDTQAARVLGEHGARLLSSSDPQVILQAAELVEPGHRDPRVEQTIGDAHALRGEWAEALARYEEARAGAKRLPASLAWRIGRIQFDQGRLDEALAAYSLAGDGGAEPGDEALLRAWTASCLWSRGDREEARAQAEAALAAASDAGEVRAVAIAHNVLMLLALGDDPAAGAEHFRRGLAAADEAGDSRVVVRLRSNRATQLATEGAYEDALAVIGPAIEAAELSGGGLQVAFPLMKRGETFLHLGRLEDAVSDFKAALAVYERFGSARRYGALVNLGDAYLVRGDVSLARAALGEALRAGETSSDAQLVLFGSLSLARAIAFDEPRRAAALARTAVETGARLRFGLDLALLASGWVALASGKRASARTSAAKAATEAERGGARPALAESLVLGALAAADPTSELASLEQAAAIFRELGDRIAEAETNLLLARLGGGRESRANELEAERTLQTAGVRRSSAAQVARPLAFLPAPAPAAVEVRTLGAFAVLRHGRPVPIAEWKSRQARELLKVLVARRGRPVPREQLMAVLWPDEELHRLGARLSFVLSTLRAVLDPEHARGGPVYVEADASAVRLREDLVAVDVEAFLLDAEHGLAARAAGSGAWGQLAHAEAAYAGDFLEEDPYADWAVALREQARTAYIAVARALAELHSGAGDHVGAARHLLRILERDAYDERAHLELVAALEASGAHGEARRAYRRYVAAMGELDVEPAPYPARR